MGANAVAQAERQAVNSTVQGKENKDKLSGVAQAVKQVMNELIRLALTCRSYRKRLMQKATELTLQQNT